MTSKFIFYFGIIAESLIFTLSTKIFVGKEAKNYFCEDCLKFNSLLLAIEYSFYSEDNINLELLDFEYHLREENIAEFLSTFSNRSLFFTPPINDKKNKIINISSLIK